MPWIIQIVKVELPADQEEKPQEVSAPQVSDPDESKPKVADQVDTYPNGEFRIFHNILTFCHRELKLQSVLGPVEYCSLYSYNAVEGAFSIPISPYSGVDKPPSPCVWHIAIKGQNGSQICLRLYASGWSHGGMDFPCGCTIV